MRPALVMTLPRTALVLTALLMVAACDHPPAGGAAETQRVAATTAGDAAKVRQLLAAGADPNKTVEVDGRQQSAWFLALNQLRPRHPEHLEIITAMLGAGAKPNAAWGTNRTGPAVSFWKQFWGPSRVGGAGYSQPLQVAMMHPVPAVVRALIDAGINPRDGNPLLSSAVEMGEIEIVHMLVDAGANVNSTSGGTTPLLAAIQIRNVALMTYLEGHGAREKP
jgi:ankyrin repeat protein